jgi:hypothetical protein
MKEQYGQIREVDVIFTLRGTLSNRVLRLRPASATL